MTPEIQKTSGNIQVLTEMNKFTLLNSANQITCTDMNCHAMDL